MEKSGSRLLLNLLGMELRVQEQLQRHSVCTTATACRVQISQRTEGQKT